MPACITFFEATVDMLWSLIGVAMTLVASVLLHPSEYADRTTTADAIVLASYQPATDVRELIARLRNAGPDDRVVAACELQRLGSDARAAITALVDQLPDASPVDPLVCGRNRHYWSKDLEQRTTPGEESAAALVAIGTESLPPLVAAARAPQWVARRNAVWALGALDDQRGVAPVMTALADREPAVRRVAAWALGALDSKDAVPALVSALADPDATVREHVAWALGAIADPRAVDGLIAALKDTAEGVRAQAAWALGAIGDRRASGPLAAMLKDADTRVRRHAAWALGAIGR